MLLALLLAAAAWLGACLGAEACSGSLRMHCSALRQTKAELGVQVLPLAGQRAKLASVQDMSQAVAQVGCNGHTDNVQVSAAQLCTQSTRGLAPATGRALTGVQHAR